MSLMFIKRRENNMKNTKELLSAQNWALVEVIHWLDENKHSNTKIRSLVDTVLNFKTELRENSEKEIKKVEKEFGLDDSHHLI